jgi:hypothetical protein
MKHIFLLSIVCASATLFGAAHNPVAGLRGLIKISKSADSRMQDQVAFCRSGSKVVACLMAGEHVREGAAEQALANLRPLHLKARYAPQDQFAKIKQAIEPTSNRTAVFVFERDAYGKHLYMRILNETTSHAGKLKKTLYCKLNSTGQPTVRYEEAGMAEEIWKDAGGLGADELGFEVDITAIEREVEGQCCSVL